MRIVILFFLVSSFSVIGAETIKQKKIALKIQSLVQEGSVILGDTHKKILFDYNSKKQFIPASVLKIVIADAALTLLGEDFRFNTNFYTNQDKDLLIQGGGDPFLISEEIIKIAKILKNMDYYQFNSLFLDDSLIEDKKVPGLGTSNNSYDSLNGALVVNFNSIYLKKDKNGKLFSAEEWTPLTKLAKAKSAIIGINKKERINVGNNYETSLQYTNELFKAIFKQQGIEFLQADYKKTKLDSSWNPILDYKNSRSLKNLMPSFLEYSNNYISNQIYFRIGGEKYGKPYNLAKSNQVLQEYISGLGIKNFNVTEGSGLSRSNKFTAQAILSILYKFSNHYSLLPFENKAYLKTGTLKNVYNLAGYIPYNGKNYPFCIFINSPKNNRLEVLNLLQEWLALNFIK